MLLKAASVSALLNSHGDNLVPLFGSQNLPVNHASVSNLRFSGSKTGAGLVAGASKGANSKPLTGVVFEPFEEVKKELDLVPTVPQVSLARQKYSDDSEAAVNEQIK